MRGVLISEEHRFRRQGGPETFCLSIFPKSQHRVRLWDAVCSPLSTAAPAVRVGLQNPVYFAKKCVGCGKLTDEVLALLPVCVVGYVKGGSSTWGLHTMHTGGVCCLPSTEECHTFSKHSLYFLKLSYPNFFSRV